MDIDELLEKISGYQPEGGSWLPLDELINVAFTDHDSVSLYAAFFKLFENHPEHDGTGVFWSAVHGMEHMGGYEKYLLEHVRKCESEMGWAMLHRLKNSGATHICDVPISELIT
ncbi:hypothetical protein [Pelagibius sp. Alg239-R121]|uniref:hypothetical protein n=1 Tax=Pelagibius sp. Alg239-R121 TaxID=2993448 RepID=UPI0024A6A1D1|nr:hypothetical protein [Pelagibius sp. Alg239-R121]